MKKYFVFMNPVSGNIKVEAIEGYLKKYLKDSFTLYVTTGKENIKKKVKRALSDGYEIIIAVGGDGTLSEVAEGLIDTTTPFVIVPTGTANNLAQELKIPLDAEKAIRLVVKKHKIKAIDAMKVRNHYFFLDVSIGAKSLAIRDTKRHEKLRYGVLAYIAKGLKWIIDFNPITFSITADGRKAKYQASEIDVVNAGIFGHRIFRYTQTMSINDGLLNVCIIRANTLWDYIKVGYRFFRNTDVAKEHVQFLTVSKSVHITAPTDLPVQGDGEIIGKRHVDVRLVPQALRVVVPR